MSAALLAAAILGAASATYLFEHDAGLAARVAMGVPLGIVLLGLVGFVVGWAFGLSLATAALAAVVVLVVPAWIVHRRVGWGRLREEAARARTGIRDGLRRPTRATVVTAAYCVLMAALVVALFDRAMFEAAGGGGGVFTGVDHNLGDLPFHLAIVTSFLYGHNFPPEHPELAGARLTYPFLVDLVAALLVAAGASVRQALRLENVALAAALVALLHRFARRLTADPLAALLAPLLVLASGGLGFLMLVDDVDPTAGGLLGLLRHLRHDYTILPQGPLRWGNVVVTMLIPQRSFLLGMPLFLVAATLWWDAVTDADRARAHRRLLAAGVITGLMPLAHAHAFAVALAVSVALALLFPDRRGWARAIGTAVVLAVPQLLLITRGSSTQTGSFLGWQVGWDRGEEGLVHFWWLNLGLFIPVLVLALVWRWPRPLIEAPLGRFYLPFVACFLLPNVLRLSPWIWDNIKFMVWWHVVSACLIALLLARLWRLGGGARVASMVLFAALTLSGALDLWRVATRTITLPILLPEGEGFAERIRELTPPGAIVLHAPTYDSEVYLSGRRTVMGYPGHTWSQGLDVGTREEDVKRVYAGAPDARAVLDRYGVDYVLVGPHERAMEGFDSEALRGLPVVAEEGRYTLLRAR